MKNIKFLLISSLIFGSLIVGCSSGENQIIKEAKLTRIEVVTDPIKTVYLEGEYFDPIGMDVVGYFDDGDIQTITQYTYESKPLTVEDTEVVISYKKKEATVEIAVLEDTQNKPLFEVTNSNNLIKRFEAEETSLWSNPDGLKKTVHGSKSTPEKPRNPSTSNEESVGDVAKDNVFKIIFNSKVATKLDVTVAIAHNTTVNFDDYYEISLNNETKKTNQSIEKGSTYERYDWRKIEVKGLDVVIGKNIFNLKKTSSTSGLNLDYVELNVSPE